MLDRQEVHAIVGLNGAGKSTLMNILSGAYQPDTGTIVLRNKKIGGLSSRQALELGISTIYQEFDLAPALSVMANIFMGREIRNRFGFADKKRMCEETARLLEMVGARVRPMDLVRNLSVANQQMVEIAKAISLRAEIVIMDEPNSALTEEETERLFDLIRKLKSEGVTIIYVSHRLEEVFQIADRITVLRDGRYMGTFKIEETTLGEVVRLMVGGNIGEMFPKRETATAGKEAYLEVKGLTKQGIFENISFSIKKGEIVGLFGLIGAGKSEIAKTLFGAIKADSGEVWLDGKLVKTVSPLDGISLGFGLVPEERRVEGLVLTMDVKENIGLIRLEEMSRQGFVNKERLQKTASQYVERLRIRTPSLDQKVRNLSGGNQQKVALARWLSIKPKVLILDEPTIGIDVSSKSEIYHIVSEAAQDQTAVLFISSDVAEILGIADRILVIHKGRIVKEFSRGEATQEKIVLSVTGTEIAAA